MLTATQCHMSGGADSYCYMIELYAYKIYLPIFSGVASLSLGQTRVCLNANEVILKDMGKIDHDKPQNKTSTKSVHSCWHVLHLMTAKDLLRGTISAMDLLPDT